MDTQFDTEDIKKKAYIAPDIEVIEVAVEKGFSCSHNGHGHGHGCGHGHGHHGWDDDCEYYD